MSNENKETKAYRAEVKFLNTIHDSEDWMEVTLFAKSVSKAEKMIKREFGKHFISVISIETLDSTPIF